MKNRIVEKMQAQSASGGKSLSVVLMIGDPDIETTDQLVELAIESGVDIVELGIPYQDPFLDSQIMRESMQRALTFSNDLSMYMDYLHHIRSLFPYALFEVMVYYDTVIKIGLQQFAQNLKDARMDAVLIADYVLRGETFLHELDSSLSDTGVIPIRFVPSDFDPRQVHDLQENSRGFIIMQTIADESGQREGISEINKTQCDFLHKNGIEVPIVFAYGIQTPEDIRKCINLGADGVLLGTAILNAAKNKSPQKFREFLESLRNAASRQP